MILPNAFRLCAAMFLLYVCVSKSERQDLFLGFK